MGKHDDKTTPEPSAQLEDLPAGRKPAVRRTLGRLEAEDSVSLTAPSPIKKGARAVPRAVVGLRAAVPATLSSKAVEARNATRDKVRATKDEKRQRVWDKLDAARKAAQEKLPRLDRFNPKK